MTSTTVVNGGFLWIGRYLTIAILPRNTLNLLSVSESKKMNALSMGLLYKRAVSTRLHTHIRQ